MKDIKKGIIKEAHSWRKFFENTHLSYYDLTDGDTVVTIKEMRYETITGPGGRKDDCLVMVFTDEDMLPMVVNTTNAKTISDLHKTNKPVEWVGKSIILYADDNVKMKGETVGGIRVRKVMPQIKLPKIDAKRFDAMCKKIEAGEFSIDKAVTMFEFTQEQSTKLIDLRSKIKNG